MVEFALVVLPLIFLLVGLFDVGRAIFAMSTTNNAAREGARLAIVDQEADDICDAVAAASVGLGINPADPCGDASDPVDVSIDYRDPDTPLAPGSCAEEGGPTMIGCIAVVRVEYAYEAATPLIGAIVGPVTIAGESSFPVENYCQVPPSTQCPLGN